MNGYNQLHDQAFIEFNLSKNFIETLEKLRIAKIVRAFYQRDTHKHHTWSWEIEFR